MRLWFGSRSRKRSDYVKTRLKGRGKKRRQLKAKSARRKNVSPLSFMARRRQISKDALGWKTRLNFRRMWMRGTASCRRNGSTPGQATPWAYRRSDGFRSRHTSCCQRAWIRRLRFGITIISESVCEITWAMIRLCATSTSQMMGAGFIASHTTRTSSIGTPRRGRSSLRSPTRRLHFVFPCIQTPRSKTSLLPAVPTRRQCSGMPTQRRSSRSTTSILVQSTP
mmetsp:Transcript_114762/g.180716  ORF Transcript_114762/g.180716 Transcript_114762/m.180716 type:complete len:224 (+) Transcript_114762:676-1347(+)